MKKRLANFVSWVGFSARQRERRVCEKPVPGYRVHKSELKEFHRAAYLGASCTVEDLLSRKKNVVDSRDRKNRTALHLACTSGQSSVVALLIQWKCDLGARDEEGKTALIKAVQCRKELCVTVLLEHGADPNLVDDCQNTALHYAVLAEDTSIAAKLLRYKANIEAINKYKYTPLLLAIRENREEMAKFLIENGANVHAVDKLQRSALMLAVFHDSPDVVKLLLEKHVNTNLLDLHGWFAGRYACYYGFEHIYQLIVDYRDGKIPTTPPQNSDLGQSSAENIQGELQLSGKDDEEEMVVELGTSNGSCTDSPKNIEQKTDLVVEFSPRFGDISAIGISPKHDVDDSRPPSDGDLDLAPKKVRHPRFAKPVQAWQEPMINTEAKDGVLKPGTSTFFEDNNSNNENEDAVRTFSQPSTEVSGFSHPAFPAPEPLTSSAVLGVTEEEATKPKTGGKENGTRTINSVVKEQADHSKLISVDGAHKSDRGAATSALGLEEKEDVKSPLDSESISEIQLPNCIDHLSGAAGLGEKNTLNGQIESSSDWDSTSLRLNNKAGQRAEHLKVDKCPLVSQSVTTNQSAPTELRQTALVVKKQMNIGAVFLSENAALRGLRQSQLPEKRSSKEADPDLQRASEEEQERLDGSENNLSQVEVEENRSKSGELKGSETICDGSYHEGLTQQRKRGKTDDQRFPALQKGDSDSCPGLHMKGVKNESGKRTLKASVTSRVFAKTASLAGGLLHRNDNSSLSEGDQGCGRSSKKMSTKKDKVTEQVNSVDDLDDLTLAPETASEDHKSLSPNCKSTLRLIEQLGPESKDSDRLLKIQDPVHSFRSIELKESDCALLTGKIKEMENKVNWLQAELLKTREAKSQLKLQNVEWERQLCSMRLTLEQETKKKKNAYILYENTKDDLKRKEKECNEQVSANQELESTARALECKRKSIRNKPNQVLEEQNDAQRQLSREQNARVIQDEILAHHLSQQKEAEKTNKKMNAEDTKDFELSDPEDNSEVLPQQLPEAERQFRGQEIELHPRRDALRPTTLVFECVHRDRGQAQRSNKETESLSQSKQGEVNRYIGKQAFLEERVCELESENVLLRQQLEAAQSGAKSKKTILNIPAPFLDHLGKLEAMSRRVLMLEEGNKELIDESRCLKDRLYQYVTDRAEMEACMRQLQQELTDTRKKVSMLEASLEVTAHHHTNSENEKQESERRSHQAANPVRVKSSTSANADLPAKVESTSSVLLHLSAETQRFLKELFMKELQKKSDTLEEEKKQLEEEVVHLRHHLEMNAVEHSPVEQYKRETEERARRDVVEKLKELSQVMRYKQETEKQARQDIAERLEEISQFLQAQAASQEDLLREYKRASVSQMEHRVKGLETELKSKTFQFDCNEKELEKYRQLYLEELENGMSLASQLNSANERLAAVSTELQLEKQHKSSLLGSVPARPVDGPPSDESSSTSVETERSLTRRRNFRNFSDPSTSISDLFRMRKKLENNIDRELKEATIELESKSYRLSRRLDGRVKSKSRSGFEST
ncbi:ankyrin repeat domain-containing protein 26-like isoform X5 [Camelus ferus]|uniref:Ankyrin repeat domain-containing protein 26-like isoform X5 n=1 Tax=Camelus ferus TaxID=419612 RepID=A0A8B8RFA2_CAMFR|nr:ankyrin repeat domain-containing protein 26-like isoform X5 [Camelus ferus]